MTLRAPAVLAGIEAGGTKVVCAVGTGPDDLGPLTVVPTTTPEETLRRVLDAVTAAAGGREVSAVGVGSFGPLDLRAGSATYGRVTATPKPGWAGTDLVTAVRQRFDVPIGLDTDVTAAALAEHRWGASRGTSSSVYLTVGTGVGGGAVVDSRPLRGLVHPEMGHLPVRRHPDDAYAGGCPFHGDCLEGLAAGPSLAARLGRPAQDVAAGELVGTVVVEAWYLAQLVAAVTYVLSPERVVLGGGVLGLPGLLDAVRQETRRVLAGAVPLLDDVAAVAAYVVPPALGSSSGVLGALVLAEQAADR